MTQASESIEKRIADLDFDIDRSARYHMRRQRFLEGWHNTTQAFTVILGSAAVGGIIVDTDWSYIPALFLTVLAAVDLVMGNDRHSRNHAELRQRFLRLRARSLRDGVTADNIGNLEAHKTLIDADEPPVLGVVNLMAYNDAAGALGADQYRIPKWRMVLGHFFDVRLPSDLKTEPTFNPTLTNP